MARRRNINFSRAMSILLVVAGIGILVAGAVYPVATPPTSDDVATTTPAVSTTSDTADSDDTDLADLGDLDLHRPLVDPPAATGPAPVDGLLQIRLAGTIVEPQHSFAIFFSVDGKTEIKSVGDRFNGVRLSAINADSVTLDVNGRAVVLHVVRPAPAGRLPS